MVAYTTCATVHPDSPAAHHAEKTGNTYLCMCKSLLRQKGLKSKLRGQINHNIWLKQNLQNLKGVTNLVPRPSMAKRLYILVTVTR